MTGPDDGPMRHGASAYPVFTDDGWVVYEPDSSEDGVAIGWVRTTMDGDQDYLMASIDGDSVVLTHNGDEVARWQPGFTQPGQP